MNNKFYGMMGALLILGLFLASPQPAQAKVLQGVVNINTATPAQLVLLPGIGKVKAEAILKRRQTQPFASVEELKTIPGLGQKRIQALKPHIVFSGPTTAKVLSRKQARPSSPTAANKP